MNRILILLCLACLTTMTALAAPHEGDTAPTFQLKSPKGQTLDLERLRSQKPVVLVFGSIT